MANRLATLDELLAVADDVRTFGGKSQATVTFIGIPGDGTTFTVTDAKSLPNVVAKLTAKTSTPVTNQYAVGATVAQTALNFANAVNTSSNDVAALVQAAVLADGVTVQIVSVGTGAYSEHELAASEPASLELSADALDGGSDQLQLLLDAAGRQINLECYGDKASDAHIYLTAHIAARAGTVGGIVKRRKIDKIETEYAIPASSDAAAFSSTKWGLLYLAIRDSLPIFGLPGRRNLWSAY